MKKLFAVLALTIAFGLPGYAQVVQHSTQAQGEGQRVDFESITTNESQTAEIRQGLINHAVTFTVSPAVTAVTVEVLASTGGLNGTFSSITSSSTLGATITFAGTYNAVRVTATGFTGSGSVDATYYGTSAPLSLISGLDTNTARLIIVDTSGRQIMVGAAASGATAAGSPVLVAGATASTVYTIATDASGRPLITGAAPTAGVVQGNPVMTGVVTAGRIYNLTGDSTGRIVVVGGAASGGIPQGAPVLVAGSTNNTVTTLSIDTSGRISTNVQQWDGSTVRNGGAVGAVGVGGLAASGASSSGNPVLVGAATGGNTYSIVADSSGRLMLVGAAPSGETSAGSPVLVGGATAGRTYTIVTDTSGRVISVGAAASGQAVSGINPVLVAGSDGTNQQTMSVDTSGRPNANVQQWGGASVTAGLTFGDNMAATPTVPAVAAYVAGFDAAGGNEDRVRAADPADNMVNDVSLRTIAHMTANDGTNNDLVRTIVGAADTGVGSVAVAQAPNTVGAAAFSSAFTSTLGTTVFAIKASAGNLYGYDIFNEDAANCYCQIFDVAAASVTLGTTVPNLVIGVKGDDHSALVESTALRNMATAISAAFTTTATGNTVCPTVGVANFFYK